jgi:hypothetical protein
MRKGIALKIIIIIAILLVLAYLAISKGYVKI